MERKASDYRSGRPGIDGLTPTEDPVAHEPMEKEPAHMTSPKFDEKEKQAIEALVAEGVARERAEQLVAAYGVEGARSRVRTSEDTPGPADEEKR
jgi:hypothetical protein